MTGRLAELARRFQDVIDHITDKPFTWGQGNGTLSDQTDLQTALDGKVNLSSGNVLTGAQSLLPGLADQQRIVREISGSLSSDQSKIILLGSMSTGRTRISGLITTSIGTTGGNRDCVTALISSLVDVPNGSPPTQISYSITQGNTAGNPARLITCEYENEPYLAIQMWQGASGNRMPERWFFQGSDFTQNEPNSLELPMVVDVSSVSDIDPFTAENRGYLSESGTKHLDGDMTVAGNIEFNGNDLQTALDGKADADIIESSSLLHTQNTDTILDEGGANEVSAEALKSIADLNPRTGLAEMQFVGSTSGSSSTFNVRWIRLGNIVTMAFSTAQDLNSLVGDVTVTGLPFEPAQGIVSGPIRHSENVTYTGNIAVFRINQGSTIMQFASVLGSGGVTSPITGSEINGASIYACSIVFSTTQS